MQLEKLRTGVITFRVESRQTKPQISIQSKQMTPGTLIFID